MRVAVLVAAAFALGAAEALAAPAAEAVPRGILAGGPVAASAQSLLGPWAGSVLNVETPGGIADRIEVRLDQLSVVGARAGFLAYPDSLCHGPLVLRARTRAGAYRLLYRELSTRGCTGDDRILIRRRGTGLSIRVNNTVGHVLKGVLRRHRVSFTG